MPEFEPIDPHDAGWDPAVVADFVTWAAEAGTRQLLIVDDGRVVAEHYWHRANERRPTDVYSAQKSLMGAAVGALIGSGVLDIAAPVSTWLGDGWTTSGPENEEKITVRHLLSMTSGLDDNFAFDNEPGSTWYYNNNAYHQLRPIIEAATGRPASDVLRELVHEPLGMADTNWRPRESVTDPVGRPLNGMFSTARDLARFGRFVLDAVGDTDGGPAAAFLRESLRPATSLNPSYGLLWWLLDGETAIVPDALNADDPAKAFGSRSVAHRLAPSAPAGTVAAMGAGDQRLFVVASHRVIVVRLGAPITAKTAAAGNAEEAIWARLSPGLPELGSR